MGGENCFQHKRRSNLGGRFPDHIVLLSALLICLVSLVASQGTGPTTVGSMTTLQSVSVTTSQDGSMTTLQTTVAKTTSQDGPMTTSGSKTTSQDGPTTKSGSRTTLEDEPMTSLSENTATGTEKVTEHHTDYPPSHGDDGGHHDPCQENITHFEVVGLEWEEVMVPFSIGVWVLIASIAKLGKFSF